MRGTTMGLGCRRIGFAGLVMMMSAATVQMGAQTAPLLLLPYTITTVGGGTATVCTTAGVDKLGDGCPATQASFGATTPVASGGDIRALGIDPQGNIIIADAGANLIRKINQKTGLVTVVVGGTAAECNGTVAGIGTPVDKYGDGCIASDGVANLNGGYTANLSSPRGVAVAPNGDIYIAGYGEYLIHKVSAATGVMSIVAGYINCTGTGNKYTSCSGAKGYTGDGGTATNYEVAGGTPQLSPTGGAELYQPRGVNVDSYGNIYIADTGDHAIRVVYEGGATLASLILLETGKTAQAGFIYTIAGNPTKIANGGSGFSGDLGPASAALLNTPEDVMVDASGDVIIADSSNARVRVIYAGGATMAKLISLENTGVVTPVVGSIYTIMGGGTGATYTAQTSVPANSLALGALRKIAMDSRGDLFAIDNGKTVVWFEDASTGDMRAIVGVFTATPYTTAPTSPVAGVCSSATDNIGDGCPATQAVFAPASNGAGLAIDGQDNLYITDPVDARIRKISINTLFAATTPAAPITQTIDLHLGAGETAAPVITFPNGNPDFKLSAAANCSANADTTVECYIPVAFQPSHPGADLSSLLLTGTTTGVSVGLSGTGNLASVSIDPGSASIVSPALSSTPQQVAVDGGGNVFVADTGNNRILLFPAGGGASSVYAGGNGSGYSGDNGAAITAKLNAPKGVAVDPAGNVYIADTGNNVLRRVNRESLVITTMAGGATGVCPLANDANGDGCPQSQSILSGPTGVAADANGNVYISDTGHNTIRIASANGYIYNFAGGAVCSAAIDTYGDGCPATQAAFSSPAGLAVDTAGNLFIADSGNNLVRKIAYVSGGITAAAGNGQSGFGGDGGLATLAQLNGPLGVAVDAASDIFIADTGNQGLRIVNPASGWISTLAGVLGSSGTGTVPGSASGVLLNSPKGVAVTSQGTLSLSDSGNSRLLQIQRSNVAYNFGTLNLSSSSAPQNFNVISTGTLAATLSSPVFSSSGVTSDFSLLPATTQGCTSGSLAAGSSCAMVGRFTPSSAAAETATYALNSNAANTAAPAIVLSGTGKVLIATSIVAQQTAPATSPQYGQTVTLSATVTPSSTTSAMTGTITFKVDGVAGLPIAITYATGVGTASTTIGSQAVGQHSVTVIYSGDFNYASSNDNATPLNITVTKANTTAAVAVSPATLQQFSTQTVTATVASTTTGTPTGTVAFYNGTALLGTSSLNSSGIATFTSATLAVGSYSVTGVYSGDNNYSTSTSAAGSFTVTSDPQDFQVSLSSPAVAIASGSTVQTQLNITPTNSLSGTLTFACTGLPQYSTCTFGPPSTLAITPTTNLQTYWQQSIGVTVTFWSDIAPGSTVSSVRRPGTNHGTWAFGVPFVLLGFGGLASARKRLRAHKATLFLALICLCAGSALTLSGCSSSINGIKYTTPAGTSNVTITVTGPNGISHAVAAQYTITGPGF
jgi:hypothetical protein